MRNKKLIGFTLAEVLITLGIIGVVAALTIPQVIEDYREKASVAQLKKTYSVLEQAWSKVSEEYGIVNNWGLAEGDEDIVIDRISPYFNTTKVCHSDKLNECIPDVTYLSSVDTNYANWVTDSRKRAAIKLTDGSVIMLNFRGATAVARDGMVFQIYVDLNGNAKPNKLGDDFFYFFSARNGRIYPGGHIALLGETDKDTNFKTNCVNANGHGCANWVLENENKDYLKCKDLSYYGKRKCK